MFILLIVYIMKNFVLYKDPKVLCESHTVEYQKGVLLSPLLLGYMQVTSLVALICLINFHSGDISDIIIILL